MKHQVIRVKDLMYKGCEDHWKCKICKICVPLHCYSKQDIENMDCPGKDKNK